MNKFNYETPQVEEIVITMTQIITASTQEQSGSLGGITGEEWNS